MASLIGEEKSGWRLTPRGAVTGAALSPPVRLWATIVLALVFFLDAVDRNILSLLLVPIKTSLHASDAAMGALTGTAFALVYAITALPMARIADRANRRNLLVLAIAFWSAMTAICGLASSYPQLMLARLGVGMGESAALPTTMSVIGDLHPSHKRGGAISLLMIGAALGFSLGAVLAGVLNDRFGWHIALMAVGAPGLLLALVMWLTVPEPQRGGQDGQGAARAAPHDQDAESVWRSLRRISRIRTMVPLLAGIILLNFAFLAWLGWLPAFLMRVHHLTTTQMSGIFALVVGIGGVLASVGAGLISDRLARRGAQWRMYFCCAMIIVAIPLFVGALLVSSLGAAVACMVLYSLAAGGLSTVTAAALLSISPIGMRALVSAISALMIAVFAGGLGPWLIGLCNDVRKDALGDQAIRYTLLAAPASLAVAGLLFALASRTIEGDT